MNKLPLILLGFLLFFLPLSRTLSFGNVTWASAVIFLYGYLLCFYIWLIVRKREKNVSLQGVPMVLFLTVIITLAGLFGVYPTNYHEVLRIIGVLWTIPSIIFFVQTYGRKAVLTTLLIVLGVHAGWGIIHFVQQGDLGLVLLGESNLSVTTAGVAKFQTSMGKLIRAYGPYQHPNSLAGALSIGVILIFLLPQSYISKKTILVLLAFLVLGILVTFSRAAFLSCLIVIIGSTILRRTREMKPDGLLMRLKARSIFIVPITIIVILFLPLIGMRVSDREDQAVGERSSGIIWSLQVLQKNSVRGVGPGNYIGALRDYFQENKTAHQPWQEDRVHMAPLLIMNEWGVPLTLVTLLVGLSVIQFTRYSTLYLVSTVPLFLLDHYMVSQTAPLMVFLVGVVLMMEVEPQRVQPTQSAQKT